MSKAWVSRTKNTVELWCAKPKNMGGERGYYLPGGFIMRFSVKKFKKQFGFTHRKNRCSEYNLIGLTKTVVAG